MPGKDALIRTGFLRQWRVGIRERNGGHNIPVDHEAVEIAKRGQPLGSPLVDSFSSGPLAASTQLEQPDVFTPG